MKLISSTGGGAHSAVPAKKAAEPPKTKPVIYTKAHSVPVLLSGLFFLLGLAVVLWAGVNMHISSASKPAARERSTAAVDLCARFSGSVRNAKSDALSDIVYIRKVYTIDENATVAPKPDPAKFGSTTDPAVIRALIDSAADLLDGQKTVWTEDIVLFTGSEYNYYFDDTILVITWKELINGKACTCSEIKIADGSQLRRKLTEDTYDSPIRLNASQLAEQCNAVIAMNADFYGFRQLGITVYNRTLYRCDGENLDTCFFNSAGEMLMVKAGELTTREAAEQFILDNDVIFSTAFGPILIQDGERQTITAYPIGEIGMNYSRAAIGTTGPLHYFFLNINFDTGITTTATVSQLGDIMYSKGMITAYTLDGGQTSEVYMNGKTLNFVDWGAERPVSDILYFATALPAETERD